MQTQVNINQQQQKIARLERQLALQKIKTRKAETRRKIELGGLVVKAKMDQYPKSIILGALIDVLENIRGDESYKKLLQIKGEQGFINAKS